MGSRALVVEWVPDLGIASENLVDDLNGALEIRLMLRCRMDRHRTDDWAQLSCVIVNPNMFMTSTT